MNTDCKYSSVVDPSTYDTWGLCPGMEARVNNDYRDMDLAMVGALEDWRELIGPASPIYKGGLHERWGSIPITIPETLPDRLSIITYATEYGFLQDDAYEGSFEGDAEVDYTSSLIAEGMGALDDMNQSHAVVAKAETTGSADRRPSTKNARKIQAWIISRILSIDPVRGKIAMNAWKDYYECTKTTGLAAGKLKSTFLNLERYINYRLDDVGCQYMEGMYIFACSLTIPEHEQGLSQTLCRPGWVAFTLVNDVCSFDKELRDAEKNGNDWMSNAIWVISQERGVSIDEAKKLGAQMLNDQAAEYIEIMKTAKASEKYSHDFLRLMDCIYYGISGSLVWSVSCPRYNTARGAKFSERQLDWIKNGIPDHLRRGDSMKSAAYNLQTALHVEGLLRGFSVNIKN
jgi:hypothetical protein